MESTVPATDLIPTAEPFFFRGGATGALLIHGYTGSPKEMRPLGEALAQAGLTVLGVRLTHHATRMADMLRSRWQDWYNSALDGYWLLRDQCQTVFVMGLSMGGMITLRMAAHYPMAGLVAMSTPSRPLLESMDWRARFALPFSALVRYSPKGDLTEWRARQQAGHIDYPANPIRSVHELRALMRESIQSLKHIRVPALVAHSRGDRGVAAANGDFIFRRLSSPDKEMLWLEKSDHVITEDCEQEQLFARILQFVRAHEAAPKA